MNYQSKFEQIWITNNIYIILPSKCLTKPMKICYL